MELPFDINCGYFDMSEFPEMEVSPLRDVTRYEIEYYTADGRETFVDGKAFPIYSDHILIAKPGQKRYSLLPFYTVYFKFSASGELAERLDNTPMYFPAVHSQKIKALLGEVILLQDDKDKSLIFYSKILELLQLILSDSLIKDSGKNINVAVCDKAKRFIDQNYEKGISLADIASSVALSPSYFHSVFTATCRMTPHDYLISRRISAAKELLWSSNEGIPEIAEMCGFGCQQYFTGIFKKHTGTTPAAYRKSFKQNYLL